MLDHSLIVFRQIFIMMLLMVVGLTTILSLLLLPGWIAVLSILL